MPKLYRVILPVRDIDYAVAFYADVLDLPGERVSPGRHYFDCDGTILACYDPVADGGMLRAGGTSVTEIATMPWGERMFYALDPFGNPISFVEDSTVFTGEG